MILQYDMFLRRIDKCKFGFRYARFDKAYLLAVDIGAKDLFMVRQ